MKYECEKKHVAPMNVKCKALQMLCKKKTELLKNQKNIPPALELGVSETVVKMGK